MNARYKNIDDTGIAILNLCISKELEWICRNTTNSDVGIDATVEQVIFGNPTAKYISIHLKTGFGNVNVKEGDIGGYIESEDNLSQAGTCWIYDEAKVLL